MIVKYYKNPALAYSNRRRYSSAYISSLTPTTEEQRSVLLGDGATTSLKTSANNICEYVTIDSTRWYVTSYRYMNGAQVELNLRRDVIGENRLNDMFGKIQRGYTETVLRNRKELSLNQVLKNRVPIKPNTNIYGNLTVPTIDGVKQNELWGILYFTKKEDGSALTVSIPKFTPQYTDYPFIASGSKTKAKPTSSNIKIVFSVVTNYDIPRRKFYKVTMQIVLGLSNTYIHAFMYEEVSENSHITATLNNAIRTAAKDRDIGIEIGTICNTLFQYISNQSEDCGFIFPPIISGGNVTLDYDDKYISYNNETYYYSGSKIIKNSPGSADSTQLSAFYKNTVAPHLDVYGNNSPFIYAESDYITFEYIEYTYRKLTASEKGELTIPTDGQLVDEPYTAVVCPLFDYTVSLANGGSSTDYSGTKKDAFSFFNYIIQASSGENAILVDAQIYPYCPDITNVVGTIHDFPVFGINSNHYDRLCTVAVDNLPDIKKDYIKRSYSIISPEQSGKMDFNYYDYIVNPTTNSLNILIKTALKPFGIISCAVVAPETGSLKNMTYSSDLRGCSPSGNGFECSLASNAYETYRRQNSNYQQIFALQKGELELSHETERVNEKVSGVVNTLTQAAMGALGGHALGGGVGAAIGGAAAGAVVGAANIIQYNQNEKLREYETYLQQQMFDLQIGTIKNLPNTINRVSSFNEIILQDFYYILEIYECTEKESELVDLFLSKYGYEIGVYGLFENFYKEKNFIKGTLIESNLPIPQHQIAVNELNGGIYYYESV